MKEYFAFLRKSVARFTIFDVSMLKACLMALGIIIGIYLAEHLRDFVWVFIVVFVLTWIYIVYRVFFVHGKENGKS